MEVKVTSENFEELKNGSMPFVVDFWAEWCGPCKMISPIISELAEEYGGKVVVGKCDVEEEEEIVSQLGIRSVPTIIFFRNGNEVDRVVGAMDKSTLRKKIDAAMA